MSLKLTEIGRIRVDGELTDQYVKVETVDGTPLDHNTLQDALTRNYCYPPLSAGGEFCVSVTIMFHPYRADEAVAIVHHQLDI